MSSPPSFYLLHGPDEFASAEFVATLKEKMGDPALASLSTTVFDGRTVTLSELRTVCDTLPFLTRRRLVVVEGWLTKLVSKGDSEEKDEDSEASAPAFVRELLAALIAYLPTLTETTALVFVEPRTLPEKHPVLKAAAGQPWAMIRQFDLHKGPELARWIEKRAAARGGTFTREAAQALAEAEDDPRALNNEIAKLLTYVNFARPVTPADVEALTPMGSQTHIFDMVDAMGLGDASVATRELRKLMEQEEFPYVFGMVVRQFRLMLQARELLEAGQTENDVARTLGIHPFPAEKICKQARLLTLPVLEQIYRRLLDCDTDIKTSRAEPAAALEALVVSLTA